MTLPLRTIIAAAAAAVLAMGAGSAMLRASAPHVPDHITLTHDGNAHLWLHVDGLGELKPLPRDLVIQVNLPRGFRLELPQDGPDVRARVEVHHDGEVDLQEGKP